VHTTPAAIISERFTSKLHPGRLAGQHDAEDQQNQRAAGIDDQLNHGDEVGQAAKSKAPPRCPASRREYTAIRTMLVEMQMANPLPNTTADTT
jgi:hypothetical protein